MHELKADHEWFAYQRLGGLASCPACRSSLAWATDRVACHQCQRAYAVADGIPIFMIDPSIAEHDELEHQQSEWHKRQQSAYFDSMGAAEFEISRPHNTVRLYDWLLREKFRLSIAGLETLLPGAHVLTVCAGSGMDAEFLAEMGARVIACDISLGAAKRCRERARRYRLDIVPIVADVERLPFPDQSVDLVYVHDGLHHLEEPSNGLVEMLRVASKAVAVTEPASARATQFAIRIGLAKAYESAGNRVVRLRASEVASLLLVRGFRMVGIRRYAMYYPHEPGTTFALLSQPGVFGVIKLIWRLANGLVGRFGNKLTVKAIRVGRAPSS